MPSPAASLGEHFPQRLSEPLARWTTLRIGGPAERFFEPQRPEDLAELLNRLADADIPWKIIGGGANTLAPDGGVPGAVVHTGALRRVFAEENLLRVWPGVTIPSLVTTATEKGWSGLELLAGVPGHVGGAIAMNAGSGEWGIWDTIREITVWIPDGRTEVLSRAESNPAYRNGNLRGAVVLEAVLALQPATRDSVRARVADHLRRKNRTQPVRLSSAGCAFKNPPGDSAGRLIDAAGLKGVSEGAIEISTMHANFLVNRGGGTAAEARALLQRAERAVAKEFGVELERELIVMDEPLEPVEPA